MKKVVSRVGGLFFWESVGDVVISFYVWNKWFNRDFSIWEFRNLEVGDCGYRFEERGEYEMVVVEFVRILLMVIVGRGSLYVCFFR